mgnify:FL=1
MVGLDGKPLAGVKVAARNTGTGIAYSSRTNDRGIYALLVPRFAAYEVKAKADGLGFMPKARAVTVGTTVARNVWGANYRAVTRVMALSDTSLAFGPVPVGETRSRVLTVANPGTAKLTVTRIECPAGWVAFPQSFEVPAGGQTTFKIKFAPMAVQSFEGTVLLRSDRTSGANGITVKGRGI